MDNWIDSTLVKLKIISKLSENDKLCFREKGVLLDPPRNLRWALRTLAGDSRESTIKNLQEMFNTIFVVMTKYINEKTTSPKSSKKYDFQNPGIYSDDIFALFYSEIETALEGLNSLKTTYSDDIEFNAKLDTLLTRVKNNLNDYYGEYSVISKKKSSPINIPIKEK